MRARITGRLLALATAWIGWIGGNVDPVQATPYWGETEVEAYLRAAQGGQLPEDGPIGSSGPSGGDLRIDPGPITVLARIAAFQRTWQVDIPGDPNDGGIREGEHLPNIIQTDNTSEAIWIWTRYFELTGDNTYLPNILKAFQYSLAHPAYNEEGGSTPNLGYYRMYNCGWAVLAEWKYRQIYGDPTYQTYGVACGDYIRNNTLNRFGSGFYDYVNPPVLSWAAGNLYDVGVAEGRQDWIDAALVHGDKVRLWVEGDPLLLPNETWAMSGGATMWGLLHSYFAENAGDAAAWLALYKDQMELSSSPGDFSNAWNGWYALGHRAVGETLSDPFHQGQHVLLTQFLIDEDGDDDGGVPARPPDSDTMDQTWVSNYLGFMGVSDIADPASSVPVGGSASDDLHVLAAPNPFRDGTRVLLDIPQAGNVRVTVHDVNGRCVATLANRWADAGRLEVPWSGRSESRALLPRGTYWLRVDLAGARSVATSVQVQR